MYPDRIDLGLGRAPGTDQRTARALRRNMDQQGDDFPNDIVELMGYLGDSPEGTVRAVPSEGTNVRYGYLVQAFMGLSWLHIWDCPTRLHPILHPTPLSRQQKFIVEHSSLRRSWKSRISLVLSMFSQQTQTRKLKSSGRRISKLLLISSPANQATCLNPLKIFPATWRQVF